MRSPTRGIGPAVARALGTAVLLLALGPATGCSGAAPGPPEQPEPAKEAAPAERATRGLSSPEIRQDGESIVIGEGDARQVLVEEAQGFLAHPSPDGRWLALDVRLLSDLQVTYLYHRDDDGRWSLARNLSTPAWETAQRTLHLDPDLDDVLRPRTRFLRWSEDLEACTVAVSGDRDGEEIELEVELELEE